MISKRRKEYLEFQANSFSKEKLIRVDERIRLDLRIINQFDNLLILIFGTGLGLMIAESMLIYSGYSSPIMHKGVTLCFIIGIVGMIYSFLLEGVIKDKKKIIRNTANKKYKLILKDED